MNNINEAFNKDIHLLLLDLYTYLKIDKIKNVRHPILFIKFPK